MIKYLLIFCFTFLTIHFSLGQISSLKIFGIVIDKQTETPLAGTNIKIDNTQQGSVADENGYFEISTKKKEISLTFSFIGYQTATILIDNDYPQPLIIKLKAKSENIKEFIINSSKLQTVVKSEHYNVFDYNFYEENILLIVFRNNLSNSELIILGPNLDTLDRILTPEKPSKIFKDCLGNNFIFCEKNIYQIYFESNKLQLIYPKKTDEYEQLITACIASDKANLYFIQKYGQREMRLQYSKFQSNNHIVSYYFINKSSKKKKRLITIMDEKTALLKAGEDRYIYEKKHTPYSDGASFYINPEQNANDDRVFSEKYLFKEIYAPLHTINDTTYIFDFVNYNIKSYSYGKPLKEIKFSFHQNKKWEREMRIDKKQNKIYALFEDQGVSLFKEVNIKDGTIKSETLRIPFSFPEKIKIQDNYIYFLYKETQYGSTKFLSRLKVD